MINISPLCMKASQQLCWISIMLGGTLCAVLCGSLTRQLFWEEWETCLESWMARRSGHMYVQGTLADLVGEKYNEGEGEMMV